MRRTLICQLLLLLCIYPATAVQTPTGLVSRAGDKSIVLHWDPDSEADISGYNVYRSPTNGGPFVLLNTTGPVTTPGYCDLSAAVVNGQTNYYQVTAVGTNSQQSAPTSALGVAARSFASDDEFLDYIQQVHFDYFWYL